jgi:hypothetical protein
MDFLKDVPSVCGYCIAGSFLATGHRLAASLFAVVVGRINHRRFNVAVPGGRDSGLFLMAETMYETVQRPCKEKGGKGLRGMVSIRDRDHTHAIPSHFGDTTL